jgi:hypothetical protein
MPDMYFDLGTYKKYLKFDKKEIRNLIISAIVIAFIVSFNEWGEGKTAELSVGLFNLSISFIITLAALLLFMFFCKGAAIKRGYSATLSMSNPMILISIMIAFFSYGTVWFFPFFGITVEHNKQLRLGMFRYQMNLKEIAFASFAGPFFLLLSAFILRWIFGTGSLMELVVKIFIAIAVYTMLPLPKTNGMNIFFNSRPKYFMYLGVVIGLALSVLFVDNFLLALLVAIGFSTLFLWAGMKLFEKIS